ncbi:hypothetical protein C8R45DRAFT_1115573 [Mycena sanguinolenta]|nr:hypothetical protein C8R45DRAFT_1115573 [Mycena sanguinolenta]
MATIISSSFKRLGRKNSPLSKIQSTAALTFLGYLSDYVSEAKWTAYSLAGSIEAACIIATLVGNIPRTSNHLEGFNGCVKGLMYAGIRHNGHLPRIDVWIHATITSVIPAFFEKRRARVAVSNYYLGFHTLKPKSSTTTLSLASSSSSPPSSTSSPSTVLIQFMLTPTLSTTRYNYDYDYAYDYTHFDYDYDFDFDYDYALRLRLRSYDYDYDYDYAYDYAFAFDYAFAYESSNDLLSIQLHFRYFDPLIDCHLTYHFDF